MFRLQATRAPDAFCCECDDQPQSIACDVCQECFCEVGGLCCSFPLPSCRSDRTWF
jgi:hypothetical protein